MTNQRDWRRVLKAYMKGVVGHESVSLLQYFDYELAPEDLAAAKEVEAEVFGELGIRNPHETH